MTFLWDYTWADRIDHNQDSKSLFSLSKMCINCGNIFISHTQDLEGHQHSICPPKNPTYVTPTFFKPSNKWHLLSNGSYPPPHIRYPQTELCFICNKPRNKHTEYSHHTIGLYRICQQKLTQEPQQMHKSTQDNSEILEGIEKLFEEDKVIEVAVRWFDGYLEKFSASEVRFGSHLIWMRLTNGHNRHLPIIQIRWWELTPESHA